MRLMVTGSRNWTDAEEIRRAFRTVTAENVTLMHGNANGLDSMAAWIARDEFGWEPLPFSADWDKHGRAAGPIRNAEMVAAKPDVCFGFPLPGSKGTYDAMAKAKAAGIPVQVFGPLSEERG